MMDVACRESERNEGQRVGLPLTDELEADIQMRNSLIEKYGVDPMDIEGMIAVNYAQP